MRGSAHARYENVEFSRGQIGSAGRREYRRKERERRKRDGELHVRDLRERRAAQSENRENRDASEEIGREGVAHPNGLVRVTNGKEAPRLGAWKFGFLESHGVC